MKKTMALTKTKSTNLSTAKISKEQLTVASNHITLISLAKNIKLMKGTTIAWKACLIDDITDRVFDIEDFLAAIKKVIREPSYNRIDYSDMYEHAVEIAFVRRLNNKVICPVCKKTTDVTYSQLLENYFQDIKCCGKSRDEVIQMLKKNPAFKLFFASWSERKAKHRDTKRR